MTCMKKHVTDWEEYKAEKSSLEDISKKKGSIRNHRYLAPTTLPVFIFCPSRMRCGHTFKIEVPLMHILGKTIKSLFLKFKKKKNQTTNRMMRICSESRKRSLRTNTKRTKIALCYLTALAISQEYALTDAWSTASEEKVSETDCSTLNPTPKSRT